MDPSVFFDGWAGIARVIVVGTAAYVALVIMLRASGKRTLSKMNAFDLVVTVALGSTLATVLLNRDVPLADGLAALGLLIALQFAITWLSVRSETMRRIVKSDPTSLAENGRPMDAAMHGQRVTRDELDAALREQGAADVGKTRRVVLETDGTISVVKSAG